MIKYLASGIGVSLAIVFALLIFPGDSGFNHSLGVKFAIPALSFAC